MQGNQKP